MSVYSQRAIAGECIQIYKYDIIGYTVIWSGRRAGESYSMPEHDVTFTQSGLDAHKFEIKLYRNYQEESPPTIIVTYGAKFDIKIPIQGYDEYMFIGWVKLSGYCMLDKITTQERYTDNNGNGIKAWTDDRAYDLIVAYAKKTNTLVNKSYYNLYTITDDGRFEQNYDILNIKQECGYSFGELYELGYRHICVNISIQIKQKDHGYQYVFLYLGIGKNDELVAQVKYDGTFNWVTYYPKFDFDLRSDMGDILCIRYGASGALDDDWLKGEMNVVVTASV